MMSVKANIMVLVAADSVNTGPVKGILQFIQNIRNPGLCFHLFNFWRHDNPVPDPFQKETLNRGIPCNFLRMGRHNYILMVLDAVRAVKKHDIAIIQTHGFKPSLIGLCIKYVCGIKWICFMHGTTAENNKVKIYNKLDNVFQRFADHVVLVSESQRSKTWGGADIRRVSVIHNAIDTHDPVQLSEKPATLRLRLEIPESGCLLAVVGRLSYEKGLDVFVKAFSAAVKDNNSLYAVIVGAGPERAALMDQAEELDVANRIRFVGHTKTPGDYMAGADIVVLPSRSEGIPNVALEAMAQGKPVIATAVGGVPEVIEDGKSGLLIPSENAEVMAQTILRLINDSGCSERISKNGLLRVKECFSVAIRCNEIVGLYQKLLENS